jgi:hypothetical protein
MDDSRQPTAGHAVKVASPHRREEIRHALNVLSQAAIAREIHIGEVVDALRSPSDRVELTPREMAAAGKRGFRAKVLAELAELEREGRGRKAAWTVARRHALDRNDPVEVETLKDKFRRWRRLKEKRAVTRLRPPR